MKRLILLFLTLLSFSGFAQNTINNYKYVLVPEKFSFLKETNQYKLNTLSKNLMTDKGFTVYLENNELPDNIATNKCIALNLDVSARNTMFSTNLTLILKDCKGNIIFKSKEGKSREKDYEVAYSLALRDAFKSLEALPYAYVPAEETAETKTAGTAVVNSTEKPLKTTENTTPTAAIGVVQVTMTAPPPPKVNHEVLSVDASVRAGILYAQPNATGYQIVNTTPKIVLILFKTSQPGYYIAVNGPFNGIVYKKGNIWFYEYYNNDQLISEKVDIKF